MILLGARNLDPPEAEFIADARYPAGARASCRRRSTSRSTLDVVEPAELDVFMPEPGGPTARRARGAARLAPGARSAPGFTGLVLRSERNEALLPRLGRRARPVTG